MSPASRPPLSLLLVDPDAERASWMLRRVEQSVTADVRHVRSVGLARHKHAERPADLAVVVWDPSLDEQEVRALRNLPVLVVVLPSLAADAAQVVGDLPMTVVVPGEPTTLLDRRIREVLGRWQDEARLRESFEERLRVMAHELRSPVAAASQFAQLLIERAGELDGDRRRQALDAIVRNTGRAARLVDRILDDPRASVVRRLPLCPLLDELVTDLGDDARHVEVVCDTDVEVPANRDHLVEVVTNLLDNAFKYGRPPVVIAAGVEDGTVRLTVTDHGDGVPAAFRTRLFDLYTRASEHVDSPGSGIGLAEARRLARAMGGDVEYEDPGAGTRFVVTLPVLELSEDRRTGPRDAGGVTRR